MNSDTKRPRAEATKEMVDRWISTMGATGVAKTPTAPVDLYV